MKNITLLLTSNADPLHLKYELQGSHSFPLCSAHLFLPLQQKHAIDINASTLHIYAMDMNEYIIQQQSNSLFKLSNKNVNDFMLISQNLCLFCMDNIKVFTLSFNYKALCMIRLLNFTMTILVVMSVVISE